MSDTGRLVFSEVLPAGQRAMMGLESVVHASPLEPALLELVKIRASQINGCAFCLDMHTKDARSAGEREDRIHLLAAWRETPLYSPRERAALAGTEALTLLPETGAPDDAYQQADAQFSEEELAALTLAIVAINGWNRLGVGFRKAPGAYVPGLAAAGRR